MSNKDKETQSRWKYRYYEALDEIETKEKAWREAERLLRNLISRLTLAADSRHSGLTKKLTELRNAVRDGRDVLKLRDLIEEVSQYVVELDKLRKREQKQGHPSSLFVEVLQQIDLPDTAQRQFRQFKKQVGRLDKQEQPDIMNKEFLAIIDQVIGKPNDAESSPPDRKQKLLERILSRQDKPKETPEAEPENGDGVENNKETKEGVVSQKLVAPAVGDLLLQMTLRMPDAVKRRINFQALKNHTNRARARKDLIPIIDVIAQQIEAAYTNQDAEPVSLDADSVQAISIAVKQFFEQLEPPIDLQQRIAELERLFFEKAEDIGSLIHCLNSLAEIVAEICQRLTFQRTELEGFFIQLSSRLQEVDSGLQKAGALNQQGQASSQQMDKAVHEEIQGIHAVMQSSDEIMQWRADIKQRLDAIDQHLQVFHDQETTRADAADGVIKDLTLKVEALEAEGDKLRTRLEETQQQAWRDVLTGIPNRQAYEERIASEIARCRRYATQLCLVVWDVDKFKSVNDNYGHAAGDKVLKVVAETLNQHIRQTDFLARFGGEEFVLLLPETALSAAQNVANKLREVISSTPFHFRDSRVPVTISGGVAQLKQDEPANDFFERADKALYAAKENGRNRIEIAS